MDSAIHRKISTQWINITKTNCVIQWIEIYPVNSAIQLLNNWGQGPVARSLVSANRWLRGIKMYRFPWYLTLVSTNHASSNPGQVDKSYYNNNYNIVKIYTFNNSVVISKPTP